MDNCPYFIQPELVRRPANALCIEIGQPATRCKLKIPDSWKGHEPKQGVSLATRWLWSGGSPLVFGYCDVDCPQKL